jgi:hypothetical protein
LAQSRLSAGQGPTPTSVGIHYGPSEHTATVFFDSNGAGGSRGSGKQMTPDHVGSYFEPAPAICCAVSKQGLGGGLSMRHFLQLALSQCQYAPVQILPQDKTRRDGGQQRTRQC